MRGTNLEVALDPLQDTLLVHRSHALEIKRIHNIVYLDRLRPSSIRPSNSLRGTAARRFGRVTLTYLIVDLLCISGPCLSVACSCIGSDIDLDCTLHHLFRLYLPSQVTQGCKCMFSHDHTYPLLICTSLSRLSVSNFLFLPSLPPSHTSIPYLPPFPPFPSLPSLPSLPSPPLFSPSSLPSLPPSLNHDKQQTQSQKKGNAVHLAGITLPSEQYRR